MPYYLTFWVPETFQHHARCLATQSPSSWKLPPAAPRRDSGPDFGDRAAHEHRIAPCRYVYMQICVYICLYTNTYMHIYDYVNVSVCMYIYIYAYACVSSYDHTHEYFDVFCNCSSTRISLPLVLTVMFMTVFTLVLVCVLFLIHHYLYVCISILMCIYIYVNIMSMFTFVSTLVSLHLFSTCIHTYTLLFSSGYLHVHRNVYVPVLYVPVQMYVYVYL